MNIQGLFIVFGVIQSYFAYEQNGFSYSNYAYIYILCVSVCISSYKVLLYIVKKKVMIMHICQNILDINR